ncbi:ABC transporter permease [Treponema phagedenis]|uniref:ABC transporter permease n=1 Tax=Treponema phagedenis TaxID=162 RepID=A0A0B7H0Z1_TREPH|nr:ABC transporter permease [Treponema phagedenis]EFW38924.1 efflux ABC transporter, permease protein [Treponema phagedenis F0421]NVP25393.1 ABC transporter permease [Treponema phagedenis]QEJ94885.1 ABC transporter permease [Treponema phagedenis]QEJ97870.1 ABC transporter permease [Treponema phagedenis]QEK00786.1 ABC transporter permease [Treponema phagedenis]
MAAESNRIKNLTVIELAKMNIKRKPVRTISLMVLTGVLSFTLFCGTYLVKSLNGGMHSLSDRLGADIIVVPEGYDSKIESALLRGEPNSFYFDNSIVDIIRKTKGVAEASPQLFIATLSAGCCSFPLQVIGLDFDSDFTIKPWLQKQVSLPLSDNQIVVGHNIIGDYHSEVRFFNQPFQIAGRLAKTGMGFDNSVFMTIENAQRLAKEYERIMQHPVAENKNLISSVMVRIKNTENARTVAQRIKKQFEGQQIYPLVSKQMMSNVSSGISQLSIYIYILIGILWLLSFVVLFTVFSSMLNERKREFGMLRILGATKKLLGKLCLAESFMISAFGAGLGVSLGFVLVLLFNQALIESLKLPFLSPGIFWTLGMFFLVILAAAASGPLASLKTIYHINKKDPAIAVRENE